MRAVAGMDKMRVAVDQAGRDQAVLAVDFLERCIFSRQCIFRTDISDLAVFDGEHCIVDEPQTLGVFTQGGDTGVAENVACFIWHERFLASPVFQ